RLTNSQTSRAYCETGCRRKCLMNIGAKHSLCLISMEPKTHPSESIPMKNSRLGAKARRTCEASFIICEPAPNSANRPGGRKRENCRKRLEAQKSQRRGGQRALMPGKRCCPNAAMGLSAHGIASMRILLTDVTVELRPPTPGTSEAPSLRIGRLLLQNPIRMHHG